MGVAFTIHISEVIFRTRQMPERLIGQMVMMMFNAVVHNFLQN
ncbi:hypothetical protein X875_18830 [Mannheimia varigena USDA-ARS-USMARC-1388]|nr:hypothetical protein X875_18830 [Mannheimia varigena USDA-ARS-USMARC-1388]